jgi:hypothetical protein
MQVQSQIAKLEEEHASSAKRRKIYHFCRPFKIAARADARIYLPFHLLEKIDASIAN